MPECYARELGDCEGRIEEEHFIPVSLQEMLGPVTGSGFAWQDGSSISLQPGSYAKSRIICRKHHDELDGLDSNAIDYFRNLMLIAGKYHLHSGVKGRAGDIRYELDGRALERWFLKTICGAIKTRTIANVHSVPSVWIQALFDRIRWPDEWAFYVFTGNRVTRHEDARFTIDFHWTGDGSLNGIVVSAFAVDTLFSIQPPDVLRPNALRRPRVLGASVQRPDGSDVLEGVPAGQDIQVRFSYPD